jgi:Tfp pilus assembly protein PilN
MFNLLPKVNKNAIRREYRIRLAVVSLWLLFAALLISSLLLLPALLLSSEKERAAQERFAALEASAKRGDEAGFDAALRDAESRLSVLQSEAPKSLLHELLTRIVSSKNDRVSLTNFSFIKGADGRHEIAVSGAAKSREALRSFIQALERTNAFSRVDAPISNFVKDTDINFEIRASEAF